MNFQEFVGAVDVHLRMTGWLLHGHNGVWRKYKKAGEQEAKPLPAALVEEITRDNVFHPQAEVYLTSNGWRRGTRGVVAGWPLFHKSGRYKSMLLALLEQLRDDRTDRAVVVPKATPSTMKKLFSDRPVTGSCADSARARLHR